MTGGGLGEWPTFPPLPVGPRIRAARWRNRREWAALVGWIAFGLLGAAFVRFATH